MTPADEAEFIQLRNQGASYKAIAQAQRCPLGTVASRSAALAAQGKITPRQRGGAKARQGGTPAPVQRPVQSLDTGAVQAISTEVEQLKADVHGLRLIVQSVVDRLDHPPVQTPVQITALPPYPQGKAVRWNLWILDAIKDQISALAAERHLSPSELVQEYLWKALTDQSPSMP
jgi:hypothetical protein